MPVFIDQSLPPPPEEVIERLEESFGHKLPQDYLQFLRHHNGAKLADPEIQAANRAVVLERFLPIVSDPANDPHGWADVGVVATQLDTRLTASGDAVGPELVPIGALFGGDFLVLDYRAGGTAAPKVSIWYHETSEEFAPDAEPIASDFTAFLDSLP